VVTLKPNHGSTIRFAVKLIPNPTAMLAHASTNEPTLVCAISPLLADSRWLPSKRLLRNRSRPLRSVLGPIFSTSGWSAHQRRTARPSPPFEWPGQAVAGHDGCA